MIQCTHVFELISTCITCHIYENLLARLQSINWGGTCTVVYLENSAALIWHAYAMHSMHMYATRYAYKHGSSWRPHLHVCHAIVYQGRA